MSRRESNYSWQPLANYTICNPNREDAKLKAKMLKLAERDRVSLLMSQPFIGSIIMRLEVVMVIDSRVPTACTDGLRIFINANFYKSLKIKERLFVLAHEVWHTALQHFLRRQNREVERFNYACDLEVYFILKQENMIAPWVLDHDTNWDGLNAETIYNKLPKYSSNYHSCHIDNRSQFDEIAIEDSEEGSCDDATKYVVIDSDYAPLFEKDIAERCRNMVITAAQILERKQGELPAYIQNVVQSYREAKLPWREILAQFVTSCYGGEYRWLPPNRRYISQGLYLQSRRSTIFRAVVAIDTSGSMASDLEDVLTELCGILHSFGKFELTVIQCDAEVVGVKTYDEDNLSELDAKGYQFEIEGYGGTSFIPVFDYIDDNFDHAPSLLIFFTDGYGDAPEHSPHYPVLWTLTKENNYPADWGSIVEMV